MYSIKAVAQATGLTVETLRAWERRYGIVVPQRDEMGRRAYRPEDVLRLRRLREATDRGHPIGRLARLDDAALARLLEASADTQARAASNAFVDRILDCVQRFRTAECEQSITLAIAMLPPQQLIHDVLQPLLREVGERWHNGEISIAQERMVSSTVRKHVGLVLDAYDRMARLPPVVFATLPGERHELGLLMSAMLCASQGFKIHYLGADLPPAEIGRYARETGAVAVAVSIVLQETLPGVPELLQALARELEPGVPIWLGGSASRRLDRGTLPEPCVIIEDPRDFEQRLNILAA